MVETHDVPPSYSPLGDERKAGRKTRPVAVAIQADTDHPDNPAHIVASGRGKLAEQILDLAFAKGIKVREDADLASLLVQLDLDTPIPPEAIMAVAEILAKVYEANSQIVPASSSFHESSPS